MPRPQRTPSQIDDVAETYTWGVMPAGSNTALDDEGNPDATLPDRAMLKEKFEEPGGLCDTCIAPMAIESIRKAINKGYAVVFVLNGYKILVGALVLGHDHEFSGDRTVNSPDDWVKAIKQYATEKYVPQGAGLQKPRVRGLMGNQTNSRSRFLEMDKIQGMCFYVEWVCTANFHSHSTTLKGKPRGAGTAILEGLQTCIYKLYVEPAADAYAKENWASDFDSIPGLAIRSQEEKIATARTTIQDWCFYKLEAIPQAARFWELQGFEEINPGAASGNQNKYMYSGVF